MPKLEIKRKLTLSRQEAADRLIALGRALADDSSEVELSSGGDKLKLSVGSTVEWELEIEIDGTETKLEIELKWRDDTDGGQADQTEEASAGAPPPHDAANHENPQLEPTKRNQRLGARGVLPPQVESANLARSTGTIASSDR